MPIKELNEQFIDRAWEQALVLAQVDLENKESVAALDQEALGGDLFGFGQTRNALQEEGLSPEHQRFYLFAIILGNAQGIQLNNEAVRRFLDLFATAEDAKNFVKAFLAKVHAHLSLELLFEIQAPDGCTPEQLQLIKPLSKHADIVCDDNYRNKFKTIVLWLKELDAYLKNPANIKGIRQPTQIGRLIDWYHNFAFKVFRDKFALTDLSEAEAKFLFDINVGPEEIERFKTLRSAKPKDQALNDKLLPNIVVATNGYFICKLSADDIRGPFLGSLTGCCQHLGGVGAAAAEYGYSKDNACFYVMFKGEPPKERPIDTKTLFKARAIVAQCLAWRNPENPYAGVLPFDSSDGGNIVFDSIEMDDASGTSPTSVKRQNIVKELFYNLAKNLVEGSEGEIQRVMVGSTGALTIGIPVDGVQLNNINTPQDLKYSDAHEQNLGYSPKFKALLPFFFDDPTARLDQAAALAECKENDINMSNLLLAAIGSNAVKALAFALEHETDPLSKYFGDVPKYSALSFATRQHPACITAIFAYAQQHRQESKIISELTTSDESIKNALEVAAGDLTGLCIKAIFDGLNQGNFSKDDFSKVINRRNGIGETVLWGAIEKHNINYINAFFAALSNAQLSKDEVLGVINAREISHGKTALMNAVTCAYSDVITAFFEALSKFNFSKAELLGVINAQNQSGSTPLVYALIEGSGKGNVHVIFDTLHEFNFSKAEILDIVKTKDESGLTPLMEVSRRGATEIPTLFDALIANFSQQELLEVINLEDENGITALMYTIMDRNNAAYINAFFDGLIKAKFSNEQLITILNAKDQDGMTLLQRAAKKPNPTFMYAICEFISNKLKFSEAQILEVFNVKDKDGKTPLMYAAANEGNKYLVYILNPLVHILPSTEELLKVVNARDQDGKTALMYAVTNTHDPAGSIDAFVFQLGTAAKLPNEDLLAVLNAQDNNGKTALMYAATNSDPDKITRMIRSFKYPGITRELTKEEFLILLNTTDNAGKNAEAHAAAAGNTEFIRILHEWLDEYPSTSKNKP